MYSDELLKALQIHASEEKRKGMEAYMRTQFTFIGVPSELRKELLKNHIKVHGLPADDDFKRVIKTLWMADQRELNYCAQELVIRKKWFKKEESLSLIEWMITHRSWWDTVDFIAATIAGAYFIEFKHKSESMAMRWNRSPDMWLIRASLLFQLKYNEKVNLNLMTELIVPHLGSDEFFIQKAIGWALRQVSKTYPAYVRQFITAHKLKPVSQREAIKYV